MQNSYILQKKINGNGSIILLLQISIMLGYVTNKWIFYSICDDLLTHVDFKISMHFGEMNVKKVK